MKCPHCLVEFHPQVEYHHIVEDGGEDWCIEKYLCPQEKCRKLILYLAKGEHALVTAEGEFVGFELVKKRVLIYPKGSNRPPAPPEVPEEFA